MEDALENLNLLDEEEEAFQEDEGVVGRVSQLCLVGRCLTDSVVYFPSLRNTLANLWHPIGGICITKIRETIQVHDLPPGLMSASMAKQFGDFCGRFIEYDTSILTLGIQHYMRIRVCLNVTAPLKRKKKVQIRKSMVVYAQFKYEKLSLFCFICGKLGHGESYCPVRHRNMGVSRWLRAADGSPYGGENLAGIMHGNSLNMRKYENCNSRGTGGNLNPNLNPLGPVSIQGDGRIVKGRDGGIDILQANELVYEEMELDLGGKMNQLSCLTGKIENG
ncbi:hypothetical protein Goshw_007721 [Gossypium schwendimanii]|uniref:CCHC-type domain-containing protein n=1 Tax=Gossypium schwendimanii TaxID=34291 RepID=A0A7J9N929_GOSSC|nr:hypothetical protein [Gossypium schwendimanii]